MPMARSSGQPRQTETEPFIGMLTAKRPAPPPRAETRLLTVMPPERPLERPQRVETERPTATHTERLLAPPQNPETRPLTVMLQESLLVRPRVQKTGRHTETLQAKLLGRRNERLLTVLILPQFCEIVHCSSFVQSKLVV